MFLPSRKTKRKKKLKNVRFNKIINAIIMAHQQLLVDFFLRIDSSFQTVFGAKYSLAWMVTRSDSSSFSPVMGSVPFSEIYFVIKRRS